MLKKLGYVVYFVFLAGLGIILGCYIHGLRTNQDTLMSGVAFVRELPQGERIVGYTETYIFSWLERRSLEQFKSTHKDIKIDPEVLKKHQDLYKKEGGGDKR